MVLLFVFQIISQKKDVVLVGYVDKGDGIGQIVPSLYKIFKESNVKSQYINCLNNCFNEIPANFIMHCHYAGWGKNIKKPDKICVAYTNFESTVVYKSWVDALNLCFDAVVVTDQSMTKIFQESGVIIPIFVLPLPFDVNKFSKHKKITYKKPETFCFGCTASFTERKNHLLLLDAFYKEFGDDPNVVLRLNGRNGEVFPELVKYLDFKGIKNIELTQKRLDEQEYIDYMRLLDCFVLISKGEGFSIPPREAMALNIPCILSNNTAHKIICDSGLVRSVKSNIVRSARSRFGNDNNIDNIGYNFDCELIDVMQALRDVYENYSKYIELARKGSEWVKQYDHENLRELFVNLVKPKKIIFGSENKITNDYFMTNSEELYKKYMYLYAS